MYFTSKVEWLSGALPEDDLVQQWLKAQYWHWDLSFLQIWCHPVYEPVINT